MNLEWILGSSEERIGTALLFYISSDKQHEMIVVQKNLSVRHQLGYRALMKRIKVAMQREDDIISLGVQPAGEDYTENLIKTALDYQNSLKEQKSNYH